MSDWDFGGAYAGTEAQLQQTRQQAEAFPLNLAHLASTTRLNNAQAGIEEHKLQSEQNLARIMQGEKFDSSEGSGAMTLRMAGAAFQAGDPTTGQNLLLRASQMQTQEARMAEVQARQQNQQAAQQLKIVDRYAQLMGGVKDEASWRQANFIFQSEFGMDAPDVPYDPKTVELLRNQSMKASDRIRQEYNQNTEKLRERSQGATASYRRELLDFRRQELTFRKEQEQRRAKEGGKDVGAPSKVETDNAFDVLTTSGKAKGLDPATQRNAAFDLASRAKVMRRQNPGLSAGEATQRALNEQEAEGYFTTKRAQTWGGFGPDKTSVLYGKPGMSSEKPLPVPKDRKFEEKRYYDTPKGPLMYLGNGKWKAPAVETPPPLDEGDDADDEEE